ncbi:hypothetical protein [Brevibacterium sp. FAM 24630]
MKATRAEVVRRSAPTRAEVVRRSAPTRAEVAPRSPSHVQFVTLTRS